MAVFDNNAGAQDFIIDEAENPNGLFINHVKTTGQTDRFFFLPMQLDHLQDEFTKIVGRPSMVPDWALGWHAAKFGLSSKDALDSVFSEHVEQ